MSTGCIASYTSQHWSGDTEKNWLSPGQICESGSKYLFSFKVLVPNMNHKAASLKLKKDHEIQQLEGIKIPSRIRITSKYSYTFIFFNPKTLFLETH